MENHGNKDEDRNEVCSYLNKDDKYARQKEELSKTVILRMIYLFFFCTETFTGKNARIIFGFVSFWADPDETNSTLVAVGKNK